MFLFSSIRPSIQKKKSYHIFIKQRFKKFVLACILALITSLLKSRELDQYSKNSKKNILFSFSIWGYNLIRKTYSRY